MQLSRRSRRTHYLLTGMILLVAALTSVSPAQTPPREGGTAVLMEVRDAIGPATSDFFVRTLKRAQEDGATLLVMSLDTPGGLDTAMRDMIRAILASSIPVVVYVAPSGARAASAGTYLLYASHVAAMAPATNLGAATPVGIGAQPAEPTPDKKPADGQPPAGTTMERKAVNDAVAYIRGLAELRGRNVEWAETAVRTGASLSAKDARAQNVIDVIAQNVPDLLRQLHGRKVQVASGTITLDTQGLVLERVETDWRTQLLSVITNPNVAYLLMLVGVYGLLLEGYNPGAIVPGVVGAISLLLALFAFQVLSVNYAGLALMLLGLTLIVAEAFAPSFGALGLGGIIAFVVGSVILMESDIPGLRIDRSLIGAIALLGGLGVLALATYFARSRRQPIITGAEQLVGSTAVALSDFDATGIVRIRGETWQATTGTPVRSGQHLRVIRIHGLTLDVEPLNGVQPPSKS